MADQSNSKQGADPASANAFDTSEGYSGQAYSLERERAEGRKKPSGYPIDGQAGRPEPVTADDRRDIPPENGRRGSFDPQTGEVHGSGSGAGGGSGAEDYGTGTSGGAPEDS